MAAHPPSRDRPRLTRPGVTSGRSTQLCTGSARRQVGGSRAAARGPARPSAATVSRKHAVAAPPAREHLAAAPGRGRQRGPAVAARASDSTVTSTDRVSRAQPDAQHLQRRLLGRPDRLAAASRSAGVRRAPRRTSCSAGVRKSVTNPSRAWLDDLQVAPQRPGDQLSTAPTRQTAQPARSVSEMSSGARSPSTCTYGAPVSRLSDLDPGQAGRRRWPARRRGHGLLADPAAQQELGAPLGEPHGRRAGPADGPTATPAPREGVLRGRPTSAAPPPARRSGRGGSPTRCAGRVHPAIVGEERAAPRRAEGPSLRHAGVLDGVSQRARHAR